MCQFIETIRVFDGNIENVYLHQKRVEDTFCKFFNNINPLNLNSLLIKYPPPEKGLFKLRIEYDSISAKVKYLPYQIPMFKTYICIDIPTHFEYNYKFASRELFDNISKMILPGQLPILIKNKNVTDSTFANLVFKKNNKLFTPCSPLLKGVQLTKALFEGKVQSIEIKKNQIQNYEAVYPINALNSLGTIKPILLNNIKLH